MSRDPRVFEVVQKQAYEQNEDRIRLLSAALKGLSCLLSDHLRTGELSAEEHEMVRAEVIRSLIKNSLDNLTDDQIAGHLDQIEVGLESNNEE